MPMLAVTIALFLGISSPQYQEFRNIPMAMLPIQLLLLTRVKQVCGRQICPCPSKIHIAQAKAA